MWSQSYDPTRFEVVFDDDHAVANAGLTLTGVLARRLGIEGLADEMIHLGEVAGAARPGRKVMTLVHSMVAGGDCIDDVEVLRSGSTAGVVGHQVMVRSLSVTSASWTGFSRRCWAAPGRRGPGRGMSR
jgi:hypothetical protein